MKNNLNRRKFLKTSALAGAAGLTAPMWLSRARAADSPEELTSVLTATNATGNSASADLWHRDTPEMVAAALKDIPAAGPGPFQESWDSIQQNYKDPDWFRDGKFGIMMHWGIYSVPAHGSEWYVRYMYGGNGRHAVAHRALRAADEVRLQGFSADVHRREVGSRRLGGAVQKGRRQICPRPRRASRRLFQLGQRINPYNAKNYGPHRDLDGDLIKAVRKVGLKTGISDHSSFHFQFIPRPARQRAANTTRSGRLLWRRRPQQRRPRQIHARLGRQTD
jgi:alpha-L-fucosidase